MKARSPIWWLLGGVAMVALAAVLPGFSPRPAAVPATTGPSAGVFAVADRPPEAPAETPLIIGPTAHVTETTSGVALVARVDTGAAVTSLHCGEDDFVIEEPSPDPKENLGKPVRIRVENRAGHATWLETELVDYVEVRSANGAEHRYRVRLPLSCGPVTKETLVNLNDRSAMTYRLLLGRDFLAGDFVVDVAHPGVPSL